MLAGRIMNTAMGSMVLNERPTTLSTTTFREISIIQTLNSLFLPFTKLSLAIIDSSTSIYKQVSVEMDEPYLRLENLMATDDAYINSILSSEVFHLYVMFFQYGLEKPEVGLMVNFHRPIVTPDCTEYRGCVLDISSNPAPPTATDLEIAVVGDLGRIRGAQVAFQFPLMPAYTGSSRLTVLNLLNILRGSLDGLPNEHHTDLTRFEFKQDNSPILWNKRGGRDVM